MKTHTESMAQVGWLASVPLVMGVLGTAIAEQGLLEQLQDRAKQGLADAQNELGNLLYDQQNFAKAIEWYKLAATQEHADALNN